MQKRLLLVLFVVTSIFFTGCTVTRMFSEKGRNVNKALEYYSDKKYAESMVLLMDTLDQVPDYKDAYENLNEKFPKVVKMKVESIEKLVNSDSADRFAELGKEYEVLYVINKRAENVTSSAKSKMNFEILATAPLKEKLAENYYKAGETYYAKGSRENKKNAAKMFSKIVKYYPEYRDAKSKYETYKEEAMQRVMFSPIKSYVTEGVNVSSLIYTNLNSYVVNSSELTEFTQILSREQVDNLLKEQKLALEGVIDPATVAQVGKTLGANIVIDVEIPVVSYSESDPSRSSTDKSWDEKYGEESYKDPDTGATKIRDLKRKKYYTEISYSKSNKAIITVAYSIKDIATSQVLKSDKFTTEAEDYAYWKIYKGDTPNKLTSQTEPDLASEAELITKCSDSVSKKLASSIIGYLR